MSSTNKIKTPTNKQTIDNNFLMELNVIEAPLFKFDKYTLEQEKSNEVEVYEKKWTDSYGVQRKLRMSCEIRLPRTLEMDTLYGLMGLFIKQNSPIFYDKNTSKYSLDSDTVYFTFYELLQYMNKRPNGTNIENLKKAIRILYSTNFQSLENGVFFDKEDNKYIINKEKGFHIIDDYSFDSKKKVHSDKSTETTSERNWVRFNSYIINNIKNSYFKYLNNEKYFSLPSGICRRLYVYLERQRWEDKKPKKFIKLKYTTLSYKLPLEYTYISQIRNRIKHSCEKKLKEIDFISDIEYLKDSVIFYFEGKKEDYAVKTIEEATDERPKTYLRKLSNDLTKEIIDRGVDKKVAKTLIAGKDAWEVKKILLYVDKQLWLGKIKSNFAGLVRTALESEIFNVYDPEIIEYIDMLKEEENNTKKEIEQSYNDYINTRIDKLKKEDEGLYNLFKEQAYMAIKSNPANILGVEENLNDFTDNGYNSKLVQDKLFAILRVHLGLMTKEEYERKKSVT